MWSPDRVRSLDLRVDDSSAQTGGRDVRLRDETIMIGSCGARDDDDRKHESIMPVNSVKWFPSCFNSIDIGIIIRIEL